MRHFSSYGPLDPERDFHINRQGTVEKVVEQLVGDPDKGGHYFTIFAPRQAGKTTTLREAVALIQQRYGDRFHVGMAILHLVDDLRVWFPSILRDAIGIKIDRPETWDELARVFSVDGPLQKPMILILDEFDALPPESLNQAVALFRKLYHNREQYRLHGLALIGVHALLGSLEGTMSPFYVQRSVRIPNLTHDEVIELYDQYPRESGQRIEPEVVEKIYDLMRGQPGLTCWFGEILTEKYNPANPTPYDAKEAPEAGFPTLQLSDYERAKVMALSVEFNTNIRNLLQKARQHRDFLVQLFYNHDIPFELGNEQLQWLYLNGLITWESGAPTMQPVCVFASPFVQKSVFAAFADDMMKQRIPTTLVAPEHRERLQGMFDRFDIHGILDHYRDYITAQVLRGQAPWKLQPTRDDARPFEAIGHFNLYSWLHQVASFRMVVSPEFRTRNGTADLVLRTPRGPIRDVIEVKSFSGMAEFEQGLEQVARYARSFNLNRAFLMVMVDEGTLALLKSRPQTVTIEGITVHIEPVQWGWDPAIPSLPAEGTAPTTSDASASPTSKPRAARPSRPRKPPRPRLSVEERLTLEDLVVPLLTPQVLGGLLIRLNLDRDRLNSSAPADQWGELVNLCEAERRLTDLFLVVMHAFPALKVNPFLVELRERLKGG